MGALSNFVAIGAVLCAVGCGGGSSESAPGPLGKHFDDMYIADIPLDQKGTVVTSQNEWAKAKMENAKAESDYNTINNQVSIVKNDQKAAKLKVDSALSNKKTAEASADANQMNQAEKELRTAELGVKAADARVKYYEAVRSYMKKYWHYTQENMYWRESQYELSKAQLAQKANKQPKGVDYQWFPKQESERSKRAASAREKAENEKGKATAARDKWNAQQQAADQASGQPSHYPDPLAPAPTPTTTVTTQPPAAPVAPAPPPQE
jgi:hypothetical protein